MNKRSVLFTVTTFLIFTSLFAFSTYAVQQKNQNADYTNQLSALNNVFYQYDSIDYGTKKIEKAFGPNLTFSYNATTNTTNITLKEQVPTVYHDDIYKYQSFAKAQSYLDVVTSSNYSKILIGPYNMSIDNGYWGVNTSFLNSSDSYGMIKSMRIDVWTSDTVTPISDQSATNSSGDNLFIYMHAGQGQDRTYNKTIDPNKETNITIHMSPGDPPEHDIVIKFGPLGSLKVLTGNSLSINYTQSFIMKGNSIGKVNINSYSNVTVNNPSYGVFKNSTVSVIQ